MKWEYESYVVVFWKTTCKLLRKYYKEVYVCLQYLL